MTRGEMMQLWLIMQRTYPNSFDLPSSPEDQAILTEIWKSALGDMSSHVLKAAILGATGSFAPTVSQIREAAQALMVGGTDGLPDWTTAWTELNEQVRKVGIYGEPTWSHEIIAETVAALGYKSYCNSATADVAMWRAQFRNIFEITLERWKRNKTAPMPVLAQLTSGEAEIGKLAERLRLPSN